MYCFRDKGIFFLCSRKLGGVLIILPIIYYWILIHIYFYVGVFLKGCNSLDLELIEIIIMKSKIIINGEAHRIKENVGDLENWNKAVGQ